MSHNNFLDSVERELYNGKVDPRHRYESLAGKKTKPNIICINDIEVGCMALQRNADMINNWVHVAYIYIYTPKIGTGSIVMSRLCKLADKYRVNLFLDAVPQEKGNYSISKSKLICWYSSFNFKLASENSNLMERVHVPKKILI